VLVLQLLGLGVRLLLALLGSSTEAEHQVQRGLLLDVLVDEGTAVLELLAGEDEALLVRLDVLLVLDLGLHVVDGVRGLHLQRDGLPCQGLHEDLHLRRCFLRRRPAAATLPEPEEVEEAAVACSGVEWRARTRV
jgi:hypothetical protein